MNLISAGFLLFQSTCNISFSENNNPVCPTGAIYTAAFHVAKALENGAEIWVDTMATRLETEAGGTISKVHYQKRNGSRGEIRARCFILAANALENPRLMLLSGLDERSDQVGRNLMFHPGMNCFFYAEEALYGGRGPRTGVAWREECDGAHRKERAAAYFHASNIIDPVKQIVREVENGKLADELSDSYYEQMIRQVGLYISAEQLPHADNRVRLSSTRQEVSGLPAIAIDWKKDDYSTRGIASARLKVDLLAETMGATGVEYQPNLGSSHIMGTTRMGVNPESSVTDAECRFHEAKNLFCAGGSVFPTGSSVNPTLTIAALSLRLAETVARDLKAS